MMAPASLRAPGARSGRHAAVHVLAAAAVYWISARLALCMAIPPGYATAVWPAAGLALICVLVWGPRAALGVALGSCGANLAAAFDATSAAAIARSLAVAGTIAAGASLQAALGAALIRRRTGFPTALHDEHDIIWFVVLGGPAACLVSATIGVTGLSVAGVIEWSGFAFSWWTWWVGDAIGVLVFAPLALLAMPRAHAVWRRRRGIVGVPLALGFAAVALLFVRVSAWERARLRTDFERRAVPIEAVLRSQLSTYEEVVTSLASFFDASTEVTRDEFHAFCARALAKYPAILALSWSPRIAAAQRTELERRARGDGVDGFAVTERGPDGSLVAAAARGDYVPVYYIEPQRDNLAVLGFDIASDPIRRAALERVARFGGLAATARIELVQDGSDGPRGVLLVAPALARSGAHQPLGYAVGAFRLRDVIETALRDIDHDGMAIALVDRSTAGTDGVLYASDARAAPQAVAEPATASIQFGDRRWQLSIAPTAASLAAQRSWQAWTVLAAGLLFVGLLGVVLLITTGRTFRVHEGAERFRALVEASAQIVWTTDAAGDVADDSPSWRAFTGQTPAQWRGRDRFAAIHADDRVAVLSHWPTATTPPGAIDTEYRIRHSSGEWRWMAARAVPLLDPHGELRGWVTSSTDITERKRAEAQRDGLLGELRALNAELEHRVHARTGELTAALREREVLLQEVHHRVKNNLQVISSLMNMQVRKLGASGERSALEECQTRVEAIALIHEQLYQSRDYANVPFSEYTRTLVGNVFRTMGIAPGSVELALAIDEVVVPVDKAIPCGLLLNELVTNALKHAFPGGRRGQLRVELGRRGNEIHLMVADDGIGLPSGFDVRTTRSLGLRLVNTLVRQMRGTLALDGSAGARFELAFAVDR